MDGLDSVGFLDHLSQRRALGQFAVDQENLLQAFGDGAHPLDQLSMGMSNDFEIAIEEGATLIRLGSALFEGTEEPTS